MEFALLGWPEDGPTLDLDHREFAYAGKFVMSATGKAVVREAGELVGAVAFSPDRTDPSVGWLRYVTVRADRRGEGIGPRLLAFATAHLEERHERVKIAVNNPFAYEAASKVGFGWTGAETGLAELVMAHPSDRDRYRAGLEVFADRDPGETERAFLAARDGPPPVSASPRSAEY